MRLVCEFRLLLLLRSKNSIKSRISGLDFQRRTTQKPNITRCSVLVWYYLEAPWYETLILELEFSPESGLEPEKSRLWSLATLLNLPSVDADEPESVSELAKEGA